MPLSLISLLVADYDEALDWFCDRLRFVLVEDTPLEPGKRWVVVAPPDGGTALLLARAADERQRARIGDQAGGRVFLFLRVADLAAERRRMEAGGVRFHGPTRSESYGEVAVFEDLYGNRWDLLGPVGPLDR